MQSNKAQLKARRNNDQHKPNHKTTKAPLKTNKRNKTNKRQTKSTTATTNPQFSQTLPFTTTPTTTFNVFAKPSRFGLNRTAKRHFGGCGSACGCGPADDAPAPESSCGSQAPANDQDHNGEFADAQYNDHNIKTIEKMRKQQRDFSLRLYRSILRSHRHLPPDMRMLGDSYVAEEFKLHKNAKPEHLQPFFEQWIDYLGHIRNAFDNPEELGRNIPIETVDQLDDEQKKKLFKMHDETYRIFGGELNEADVGLPFDQISDELKQSGIFGQEVATGNHSAAAEAAQFVPQTEMAPKIKLTTTTTNSV